MSSLVMLSGEALNIYGEGLAQFKLARICKAALIAPDPGARCSRSG